MVFRETTIEGNFCGDLLETLTQERMISPYSNREAKTSRHPYEVLDILEAEGYKVVGTNTSTRYHSNHLADCSNHVIWTLHKQA